MATNISFSSFYALLGGKLVAAYVDARDGIVRSRAGEALEFDPETTRVLTRGSVQSAVLKGGYNRIDHLAYGRVQASAGWRARELSVYEHIEKMAPTTEKALALIELVMQAYAPEAALDVAA